MEVLPRSQFKREQEIGATIEESIVVVQTVSHCFSEGSVPQLEFKMDPCVTCKAEVGENHRALRCDICNQWEHVGCVRQADRHCNYRMLQSFIIVCMFMLSATRPSA